MFIIFPYADAASMKVGGPCLCVPRILCFRCYWNGDACELTTDGVMSLKSAAVAFSSGVSTVAFGATSGIRKACAGSAAGSASARESPKAACVYLTTINDAL